jgi:hypothetical protein
VRTKGRDLRKECNDKRDRIGLVWTDREFEFEGDGRRFNASRGAVAAMIIDTVPFHKMACATFATRRHTGIVYKYGSFATSFTLATSHLSHPNFIRYRITLT